RRAFSLSHARLGRLLRNRFVREDADPDLAATLDVARERHARGLDLPVGNPTRLGGLQSVSAERNLGPTSRQTLGASLEHLPELYSLRTQHSRDSLCVHSSWAWGFGRGAWVYTPGPQAPGPTPQCCTSSL